MSASLSGVQNERHRFASALQAALTMEEVERAFLDAAGAVIPAGGFGFYRLDPATGEMLDVNARVEINFLADYESYGRSDDPVLAFVIRHNRPIDSSRLADQQLWEQSGARTAIGAGGYCHSLEAPVMVSGVLYGTINFARAEVIPAFSDVDLVSARAASEQLGLAIERALRYEQTGRHATTLEDALDRIPQAIVVTDLDASVIFRNRAARVDHEQEGTAPTALERAIAEAMAQFRNLGKRVYALTTWDDHAHRHMIVKSYRLRNSDGAAVTLVFQSGAESPAHLPTWDVLSRREQEIAELVSRGLTNKQIADQAFISENTVKQHLKRVFAKANVHNRAELMQRIWAAGEEDGARGREDPRVGPAGSMRPYSH